MTELESGTLDLDVKENSFKCDLTEESEFSVDFGESGTGGDVPIATDKILGKIRVGENLKITPDGILSVDTAEKVEGGNTKPVTSAAVYDAVKAVADKAAPAKSVKISDLIIDGMTEQQISDAVTAAFETDGITNINIDKDVMLLNPIELRDYLNVYSSNGSTVTFKSCDGFTVTSPVRFFSLHDLIIKGNKAKGTTLLKCVANGEKCKIYNLSIGSAYDAIFVDGWVYNFRDINVWDCKNIGLYITKSDNTYSNIYLNTCDGYGLYMQSSNNRLENFKILSCGKNVPSAYFSGRRNSVSGFEIQDIFTAAAEFEYFDDNICDFNFDGLRTNLQDPSPITLVSFKKTSNNNMRLISSKYGSSVGADTAAPDVIRFDADSSRNALDIILNNVKIVGGLNNSYGHRGAVIKLPPSGVEKDVEFRLSGGIAIANLPDFLKLGFTTNADTTSGGYRFKLPKDDTRYLFYMTVKVDKPCTLSITNQMSQDSGKFYVSRTVFKGGEAATIRAIITSGNVNSAIVINRPSVTALLYDFCIYELPDIVDESDLFDCQISDAGSSGTGEIKIGENLKITSDGAIAVDTAEKVEQDNTKPVTSAAVYVETGNIEALLSKI